MGGLGWFQNEIIALYDVSEALQALNPQWWFTWGPFLLLRMLACAHSYSGAPCRFSRSSTPENRTSKIPAVQTQIKRWVPHMSWEWAEDFINSEIIQCDRKKKCKKRGVALALQGKIRKLNVVQKFLVGTTVCLLLWYLCYVFLVSGFVSIL